MEKYTSKDWAGLSRRARGPRNHRAKRIKSRMAQYIQSRDDLTPSAKLAGGVLVRWYNERVGYSWPSTSTLASETGLTVRTVNRATAELHELGIIHKEIGGGFDHRKIRYKANRYYPAFSLVLESAENGGNLPKNPDNLSSLSNCQGVKSENRQNSAEHPCHFDGVYGDKHIGGANAAPASPNGSTVSTTAPQENESEIQSMEKVEFFAELGVLALTLGTTSKEFLAAGAGPAGRELDRLCDEYQFPGGRPLKSSPLEREPSGNGLMACVRVVAGEASYREIDVGLSIDREYIDDETPVYIEYRIPAAYRDRKEKEFQAIMAAREY